MIILDRHMNQQTYNIFGTIGSRIVKICYSLFVVKNWTVIIEEDLAN